MQLSERVYPAEWPRQTEGASLCAATSASRVRLEEDGAGRMSDSQVCVPAPHLSQQRDGSATLLQFTSDLFLGRTRAAVLRKASFDVLTVLERDIPTNMGSKDLAVILFCQTVSRERAIDISKVLCTKRPRPFTARLTSAPYLEADAFDAVLATPVTPSTLVLEATGWERCFLCRVDME